MDELQPGQVISPRDQTDPVAPPPAAPEPERPEEPETSPTTPPLPSPEPVEEPPAPGPAVDTISLPEEQAGWHYNQEPTTSVSPTPLPDRVSWTASEFIAHDKGMGWYAALALVAIVGAALDYLVTKDVVSASVILFVALGFGFFAARKPQTKEYNIDNRGVWIGNKNYPFQDFKTFSVVEEEAASSVVFMPLKRFMPPLTIYMDRAIEDKVVNYLASFLPFEQHKSDMVDNLLRRIRF